MFARGEDEHLVARFDRGVAVEPDRLGVAEDGEWDRFPEDSIEGRLCRTAAERLRGIASTTRYCVESQYFIAKVDAWFGRAHLRYNALIYRQRNRMPELLWVQRI